MFSLIKRLQVDWSLWLTLPWLSPTYPTLSWRWVCSLVWSSPGLRAEDRDPQMRWAVAAGMSALLDYVPWGLQLCFIEGVSVGSLGGTLRFDAGHSDLMIVLLRLSWAKGEAREVCQRWSGDRIIPFSVSDSLVGTRTPRSKNYVFEKKNV